MGIARIFRVAFLLALAAAGAPALAQAAPQTGPIPAWVKPAAMQTADPTEKDKPLQILLLTLQARHHARSGSEYYFETATQVQNPQGLAAAGTVAIPWQPDQADLVVHKVEIVRDGKAEDVLGKGQTFTVLRRENNLEAAMLDGALTAVLQPEGLSVGDVLRVAFSIRRKSGSIAFRPENAIMALPGVRVRQARYRDVWDKELAMRWRASPLFGKPVVKTLGDTTELVFDLTNFEPPAPPESAPSRFAFNTIEVSGYKDWAELSRLMAPLYVSAAKLAPASPLQTEIDKIAAAEKDPKRRAMAALRLVQDRIRYVAYGMGEAGFIPATADQTWSRKFGDCKGKTAVLLAMLSALGIEAEPVAVSSTLGNGLNEMLPLVRAFDHVLVRATIDGRSYWLDGTRAGERDLASLASSAFEHGLPLRAAGAGLEALPLLPPEQPLHELEIAYDAAAGFNLPVPVRGKGVLRDPVAAGWRQILSQAGEEKVREALLSHLPLETEDVKITSLEAEGPNGEFIYSFSGKSDMDWSEGGSEKRLRFQFDRTPLTWEPDFEREPGPGQDAPFALNFPSDYAVRETVTLPRNGEGFTVDGVPIDETLVKTRFTRSVSISGDRAVALSRVRRLAAEVSAAEARAATKRIAEIDASRAWIVAPRGYAPDAAEQKAIMDVEPVNARDFIERGYRRMNVNRVKEALADFDKAIELSPKSSRAYANRGVALIHLQRFDEAEKALLRAKELNEADFVVHQGLGLLRLRQDRPEEAVPLLTRSIELDPDNVFSHNQRSVAYRLQGRFQEALADVQEILSFEPGNQSAAFQAASLHTALAIRTRQLPQWPGSRRLETPISSRKPARPCSKPWAGPPN
ncbi:MAG TPA: DUF3857 domain-containing protein [Allosphingosinicella sp.]